MHAYYYQFQLKYGYLKAFKSELLSGISTIDDAMAPPDNERPGLCGSSGAV